MSGPAAIGGGAALPGDLCTGSSLGEEERGGDPEAEERASANSSSMSEEDPAAATWPRFDPPMVEAEDRDPSPDSLPCRVATSSRSRLPPQPKPEK